MKTKGRQLQRACEARWLSSEAILIARSEILGIWATLKQLSENKNDAYVCCFTATYEKKTFNMVVNVATSPGRTEQRFSGGMF